MTRFRAMLARYFTPDQLSRIQRTRLTIIGCGGLGSNAAQALVRCGFEKIVLIDFDLVALSNLNRQAFHPGQCGMLKCAALRDGLSRINTAARIVTRAIRVAEDNIREIIGEADIVLEAVDQAATKRLIFENCLQHGRPVVCASGIAGFGDCENLHVRRGRHYAVIGDGEISVQICKPLAPKVMAAAAMQADEVLRMVLHDE
ncbi:MAG: sulfur carrier protein ThiS adenylyltransferase ThiF [Planctomycetota bacterium]